MLSALVWVPECYTFDKFRIFRFFDPLKNFLTPKKFSKMLKMRKYTHILLIHAPSSRLSTRMPYFWQLLNLNFSKFWPPKIIFWPLKIFKNARNSQIHLYLVYSCSQLSFEYSLATLSTTFEFLKFWPPIKIQKIFKNFPGVKNF